MRIPVSVRFLAIGLAALLCHVPIVALAAAPRFELEIDLPDELTMANRPATVGTNVRNARVQRRQLKSGRLEEMVSPPIVAALRGCSAVKSDAARLRVRVSEGAMKDSIGDSSTMLKGVGLYLSLPEAGLVDMGTWSATPFVALVVELRDETGRVLASQEVNGYQREVAPEGMLASEFLAQTSAKLDALLDSLARSRLEKAMPAVLAGVCAPA